MATKQKYFIFAIPTIGKLINKECNNIFRRK